LLRGAEQARLAPKSVEARLMFEVDSPPPRLKAECLVQESGNLRRFERFAHADSDGSVVLVNGSEVHAYDRLDNASVRLCDKTYSVETAGDLGFDPRTLGLTDLPFVDSSVKKCLWSGDEFAVRVIGQEAVNGVAVWRVEAKSENVVSTYWIEEPSFRVHRRLLQWPGGKSDILSEFDSKIASPFPSRVTVDRIDGDLRTNITIEVLSLDLRAVIPPEQFTLASFDLPVDTMIIDYRTQKIVGYWDGAGLSVEPLYVDQIAESVKTQSYRRQWLLAINVAVVVTIAVLLWWKRRVQSA
jgi:hypothetical protein